MAFARPCAPEPPTVEQTLIDFQFSFERVGFNII